MVDVHFSHCQHFDTLKTHNNTMHVVVFHQEVAEQCGISAMPTFQVFKDGKKVDELVGASKEMLLKLLEKWA